MKIVVLAVTALLSVWPSPGTAANGPAYDISILDTSPALNQTVSSAFLRGEPQASLIVTAVEESGARRLALYVMRDGKFRSRPEVEMELAGDVILTEVCKLESGDAFIVFTRNEALAFDLRNQVRRKLVEFTSLYNVPLRKSVPKLDLCQDLNDDGLDDFIIPNFDGFQLFIQRSNGAFNESIDIHAPPAMEMFYNDHPWYEARSLYRTDMNLDGRQDLVFWVDDHFAIYRQLENGLFDDEPVQQRTDIPFEHEGTDGLSVGLGEQDVSDMESTALYQLADLDADGIPDLVTLTVRSKGVFDKQTTYEFHKGRKGEEGRIEFEQLPESRIRSEGIQFAMEEKDFDMDEQVDVVISSVELGLGKILAALLTRSISVDLDFYAMQGGRYPANPNVTRKIKATFDWSTGEVFYPTVLMTDIDADGLVDLLVQLDENTLRIYSGRADQELFDRESVDLDVPMPQDPELVELANLNDDGRPDLVIRHRSPARVVVLVSQ